MKSLRIVVVAVLVAGLFGSLRAEEKKPDNKTLIVGVWELTKAGEGAKPPVGTTMEYTKDGKIKMTGKADGKEFVFDGTYVVEGNKLTGTMKTSDREEKGTLTIKRLTDKELVTEDEAGRVLEFKRKK
jgi:uncharacterized protein (TIGR03066 family)